MMNKFSSLMKCFVDPQDQWLKSTSNWSFQWRFGVQRFPFLPETILQSTFVMGRPPNSSDWRVSDSRHRSEGIERNYSLPERLHTFVQLFVVDVERMAQAHWLDGTVGHNFDLGTVSRRHLDGCLHGIRHESGRDRWTSCWTGVFRLAEDGEHQGMGWETFS